MSYKTIVRSLSLSLSLLLMAGCGGDTDKLERQIKDLQAQLKEAKDPAAIQKLQIELLQKQRSSLEAKSKEMKALEEDVKKTTTQAACDKIKAQIEKALGEMESSAKVIELASGYNDHGRDGGYLQQQYWPHGFDCGPKGYASYTGGGKKPKPSGPLAPLVGP